MTVYFLAEVIGGLWTGSLALLADAGHMFSDMAALVISLFAARIAVRRPGGQRTFGYHRAEILAALANGSLLFLVAGGILHEAWERLWSPREILAGPMLGIAFGGLIVNLISLKILHGGRQHNLNVRGAWLHVLGDAVSSVGVLAAGALVWAFGWLWADPAASIAVCLLIAYSAWNLVSEAALVLMEHAPRDIEVDHVRQELQSQPDVLDVHCLHIWTIASGLRAVSAHVVLAPGASAPRKLNQLREFLRDRYALEHITLQLECAETAACADQTNGACLLTGRWRKPAAEASGRRGQRLSCGDEPGTS